MCPLPPPIYLFIALLSPPVQFLIFVICLFGVSSFLILSPLYYQQLLLLFYSYYLNLMLLGFLVFRFFGRDDLFLVDIPFAFLTRVCVLREPLYWYPREHEYEIGSLGNNFEGKGRGRGNQLEISSIHIGIIFRLDLSLSFFICCCSFTNTITTNIPPQSPLIV